MRVIMTQVEMSKGKGVATSTGVEMEMIMEVGIGMTVMERGRETAWKTGTEIGNAVVDPTMRRRRNELDGKRGRSAIGKENTRRKKSEPSGKIESGGIESDDRCSHRPIIL